MILITRAVQNTIVATLSEKVTISNPFYLLVLKGKSQQPLVKKILSDSSAYPLRYNMFVFTEGVDLTVPNAGDYTYTFYQKAVSNTDIPADDADILETGIARVVLVPATIISHSVSPTTIVYES